MIRLFIIADDFTGALDTGVQFSKHGIRTLVTLKERPELPEDDGIQVLVMDTESRHVSPELAYVRVKAAADFARQNDIRFVYKKTDSTLRGNIGSEFRALLDTFGGSMAFVPAFPKMGRTTVQGVQYVHGKHLQDTPFAADPLNPVKNGDVSLLLREQAGLDSIAVPAGDGADGLFPRWESEGRKVYVFDASREEDLEKAGEALKAAGRLGLTAGCAGFAAYLPELLELGGGFFVRREYPGGVLAISGSVNEVSVRQTAAARKYGFPVFTLTPVQKLDPAYFYSMEGQQFLASVGQEIKAGRMPVIQTLETAGQTAECAAAARALGLEEARVPGVIADNLGRMVRILMDREPVGTVVVFGGDTAAAVIRETGSTGILPGDEILPGVAVSEASGCTNFRMVTKAGGFGNDDVLVKIREYLQKETIKCE